MPVDLQQVINSPFTVRFVSVLARVVPPAIGYPACDLIGKWAATRRQSTVTQAVRVNQWVARGRNLDKEALDRIVQETLQNNVRDLYDLYHHLEQPDVIWRRLCLHPLMEELVRRPEFSERGLVVAGIHLSNFDSVMLSMIHRGAKAMVLTIPNPRGGRRVEFEMRKRIGMNIVPASLNTIRQAVRHLERGGLILTGMDRPIVDARLCPRFFDRPAPLPTHHIYLALKARVPVVVVAAIRQKDGNYNVVNSEPIEMEHNIDHETAILHNAERALKQAEDFIRLAPQQWNVPLPIWSDLLKSVPT